MQSVEQGPQPALPFGYETPQEMFDNEALTSFSSKFLPFSSMQPMVDGTGLDQFGDCPSSTLNHLQDYHMTQSEALEQGADVSEYFAPRADLWRGNTGLLGWDDDFPKEVMDLDQPENPLWMTLPLDHYRSSTLDPQHGYQVTQYEANGRSTEDLWHGDACISLPQQPLGWENGTHSNVILQPQPQCLYSCDTIPAPVATFQGFATIENFSGLGFLPQDPCQIQTSESMMFNRPATALHMSPPPQPSEKCVTNSMEGQTVIAMDTSNRTLKEPSSNDWCMLRPIGYSLYTRHTLAEVREILKNNYGFKTR